MNWNSLKKQFRWGSGRAQSRFVLPTVVLEIEPDFVVGARVDAGTRKLRRLGVRQLEPRAIEAFPNAPNVSNVEELQRAFRGVTEVIGYKSGRLGLLVPDGSVRVAIMTFETLPDDPNEEETLVRWRMKENLPYPPEEAKLSYQLLWNDPGNVGMMVVAAKASLLAEYIGALGLRNGGPELILPATAALLPLMPESGDEGRLLVHVCSGWVTTVAMKGTRVRSWRTRAAEDMAKDVASEVFRVLASCRDHLQFEVDKVWLCARPPATSELGPELASAISKEVLPLAPGAGDALKLSAAEQATFESFGAPLAGLIANTGQG
jgi:hypothetical protein